MRGCFKRKFNGEQIHDIRFGGLTNVEAAEKYECEPSTIARIRIGIAYKEFPFDPEYQAKAKARKNTGRRNIKFRNQRAVWESHYEN